jgi:HEAT repeat protein
MAKSTRDVLGLTLLAVALVLCAGCRGDDSGQAKKTARKKRDRKGKRVGVLRKGQLPRDVESEVARLLGDLGSGDMLKAWRAEEKLGTMGAYIAPQVRLMLDSRSPEARGAACRLAHRFKDKVALAPMIDLLSDESRLVRVEAGVCLSGMTGQDFNFRADALTKDRNAAIERWQQWYVKTHGAPGRSNNRRRR